MKEICKSIQCGRYYGYLSDEGSYAFSDDREGLRNHSKVKDAFHFDGFYFLPLIWESEVAFFYDSIVIFDT